MSIELQKIGIEIRKIGSVKDFYRDVDRVLKNYEIPQGDINIDIQRQTVAHALQKMLKVERHFCVCTVRKCIELSQIVVPRERMKVYETMHCVNWDEMLPDYRTMLVAMILDDFRIILNPE